MISRSIVHDCRSFLRSWSAGSGPIKDAYNIGENPQFRMEVKPGASGAVWILLTRHITQIDDFRENREYITVLVYKNDGRRVYYPCKYIVCVIAKKMLQTSDNGCSFSLDLSTGLSTPHSLKKT